MTGLGTIVKARWGQEEPLCKGLESAESSLNSCLPSCLSSGQETVCKLSGFRLTNPAMPRPPTPSPEKLPLLQLDRVAEQGAKSGRADLVSI